MAPVSMRPGFTSMMMDGSLMEDIKTHAPYGYNTEVTAKVVDSASAARLGAPYLGLAQLERLHAAGIARDDLAGAP